MQTFFYGEACWEKAALKAWVGGGGGTSKHVYKNCV
jgi:hypothetical protein